MTSAMYFKAGGTLISRAVPLVSNPSPGKACYSISLIESALMGLIRSFICRICNLELAGSSPSPFCSVLSVALKVNHVHGGYRVSRTVAQASCCCRSENMRSAKYVGTKPRYHIGTRYSPGGWPSQQGILRLLFYPSHRMACMVSGRRNGTVVPFGIIPRSLVELCLERRYLSTLCGRDRLSKTQSAN
ncbi:hypothetical protein BJX65DRAFT_162068 [Aspergillus insuetus]